MTQSFETERKIERTAKSAAFYRKVFGDAVSPENVQLILDVGAGDSPFAEDAVRFGQTVTRVDLDYADDPPIGENWAAASATDLWEYRGQYDVAISAFMMQHLDRDDQSKALQEMIDATVKRTKHSGGYQGVVGVFPVYKSDKLRNLLDESGLSDVAFVRDTGANSGIKLPYDENHLASFSTLYIVNDERLDENRKKQLTELIAQSDSLNRRKTVRDMARRAFMKPGVTRVRR